MVPITERYDGRLLVKYTRRQITLRCMKGKNNTHVKMHSLEPFPFMDHKHDAVKNHIESKERKKTATRATQ